LKTQESIYIFFKSPLLIICIIEENPEVDALNKLKAECLELAENYKSKKDKKEVPKILKAETVDDVKNKFDIVDSNSKDDLEEKEEEQADKEKESLTPNTDSKLKQFFNSIQQEDEENKEEDDDVDLDEYISNLENKE